MRAKATITIEFELAHPDEYPVAGVNTWQEAAVWDTENCMTFETEMDCSINWGIELLNDPDLEPFERSNRGPQTEDRGEGEGEEE